jgi:hypothetical protein
MLPLHFHQLQRAAAAAAPEQACRDVKYLADNRCDAAAKATLSIEVIL